MKKILLLVVMLLGSTPAYAADKEVRMQVLGAVCPSCAYGLEKKFMKIEGVKKFDVDFKAGIVSVCAEEKVHFTNEQLMQIFKDAGYSYQSQEERPSCQKS